MLFRSIFGGRSETNSKRVVTTTYFIPKLFVVFIIIYFLAMFAIESKSIKMQENKTIINNIVLNQDTSFIVSYNLDNADFEKIELNNISITSYNNEPKQTDSTPNIMASNRLVYEGAVAISPDLKSKYKLKYGDLIYIHTLQRYYVIEDLMNKRFKNRIDIFSFDKKWSLNLHLKNQKVVIYKINRS